MHGELAQLVALAAHGSAFLAGPAGSEPPELFPSSSVFKFTNTVEFHRRDRRLGLFPREVSVLPACAPWFADLRSRGASTLRLSRSDETLRNRLLAPYIEGGFSGGLDVSLVASFPGGRRERWSGRWAVTSPQHPEQRIWRVDFHGAPTRSRRSHRTTRHDAAVRLDAALGAAESLVAGRQYFESWEKTFRDARSVLASAAPEIPYHPDLLPAGSTLDARQLLGTASHAWVFGGMGSWNDVALTDDPRYKPVTAELFEAMIEAVVAATNEPASE
jgi:hypothetical protein